MGTGWAGLGWVWVRVWGEQEGSGSGAALMVRRQICKEVSPGDAGWNQESGE